MDSKVSVIGCESYAPDTVERALDALLSPIAGLDWVKPGMKIAVKVNLVVAHAPERAATTHPELVKALCRRLVERGAEVVVGDSPGGPYSKLFLDTVYRATGMTCITETGATLNHDFGETEVKVPNGRALKTFWCCDFLFKADAIIDFCKLKTHAMMGFTGACKNLFGGITGTHKAECHYLFPSNERFAAMLVDLCEYFKPTLSICDGVLAMEGNGPSSGHPRHMGVLLAAFNPHALDLAAASLIGLGPNRVPTLAQAIDRGLAPEALEQLELYGDLEPFRVDDFQLQPPVDVSEWGVRGEWFRRLAKALLVTRPRPDNACVGCGECAKICPAKAIVMEKRRPRIDRDKCISCFCCGEFCPKGAMKAYEPLVARLTRGRRA